MLLVGYKKIKYFYSLKIRLSLYEIKKINAESHGFRVMNGKKKTQFTNNLKNLQKN